MQAPRIKYCPRCKTTKSSTEYTKTKHNGDGLESYCKPCRSKYQNRPDRQEHNRAYKKQWRKRKRETDPQWVAREKAKNSERHQTHSADPEFRDRAKRRAKDYYAEHPEFRERMYSTQKTKRADPAYRSRRNERERSRNRERSIHDSGYKVQKRAYAHRHRARKRAATGSYTQQDVQKMHDTQRGRCYYCHDLLNGKYHVDHVIPLSRGGSNGPENLVLACPHCNLSKNDKMPHEWVEGGRLL